MAYKWPEMNIEIWVYRPSKGQSQVLSCVLLIITHHHIQTHCEFFCPFPESVPVFLMPLVSLFSPLFSSPPLFPAPPFPSSTPAVPVPCPLLPKLRGRVVFLKQWGNHLWCREQKEMFTVSVMKRIFARRMESVNRVSRLVGKDN